MSAEVSMECCSSIDCASIDTLALQSTVDAFVIHDPSFAHYVMLPF